MAGRAKTRQSYHHGSLPRALVEAATALLEAKGPLGVTLRGAARKAGVSQTAPYRHFRDKGSLLAAVAEDGFRDLIRAMERRARAVEADPVRALQAMAGAVVGFAAKHPSHYRLMSGPAVRGRDHARLRAAAIAAWQMLTGAVEACQRVGRLRPGDPAYLAFVLWSLVHGLAVLVVDEQIPPAVLERFPVERLVEHAIGLAFAGLARSGNLRARKLLRGRRLPIIRDRVRDPWVDPEL